MLPLTHTEASIVVFSIFFVAWSVALVSYIYFSIQRLSQMVTREVKEFESKFLWKGSPEFTTYTMLKTDWEAFKRRLGIN